MQNKGLKLQADFALESIDTRRRRLVKVLQADLIDDIPVEREMLASLYAHLGNNAYVIQKLVAEVRNLEAQLPSSE